MYLPNVRWTAIIVFLPCAFHQYWPISKVYEDALQPFSISTERRNILSTWYSPQAVSIVKYCFCLILRWKVSLTCNLAPQWGAGASVRRLFYCPTMPTIHTHCATFGQSVGEMVYTFTECPFALCLGYRAKVLTLGKDCLLIFISWFHFLSSLFYSSRNTYPLSNQYPSPKSSSAYLS